MDYSSIRCPVRAVTPADDADHPIEGPRIWQAILWYRWFPCTFDQSFAIRLILARNADGDRVGT